MTRPQLILLSRLARPDDYSFKNWLSRPMSREDFMSDRGDSLPQKRDPFEGGRKIPG